METAIYLPSGVNQFNHFRSIVDLKDKSVLIIGANTNIVGKKFLESDVMVVNIILDDYDLLINTRLAIKGMERISSKFMEYTNTDFDNETFDIVYAQGSISTPDRNKILKEVKRILKPRGMVCIGEYISLQTTAQKFVEDIWESGNVAPLHSDELVAYYQKRDFDVVDVIDLSSKLKEFYLDSKKMLDDNIEKLTEGEKIYHKKLLKRINHESNVYLNLGGSEYMGFSSIILRKTK